jgi:hypothetical protein
MIIWLNSSLDVIRMEIPEKMLGGNFFHPSRMEEA